MVEKKPFFLTTVNKPLAWLPFPKCFNSLLIHKIVCLAWFQSLCLAAVVVFQHICVTVTQGFLCVSAKVFARDNRGNGCNTN